MKRGLCVMAVAALIATSTILCAETAAPARAKVGAYYFDGWTSATGHLKERLKTEFFDREPVWGWNDEAPETMVRQIDYAADNSIGFFAFDWYYPEGANKYSPLNTGLDLFLKAPNRTRMEFCLLVANHGGFRIGPKDWDAVCNIWVPLFKQNGHVTVDNKPLLIFFSPGELRQAFGTTESVRAAFEKLRAKCREAGLPGATIAACCTPGPDNNWSNLQDLADSGYDVFTGYNYHGHPVRGGQAIQAFSTMIEGHEDIWNRFAQKTHRPYIPVVTAGWDKRPWEERDGKKPSVYYPDRTPYQVADFLNRAISWMDTHPAAITKERLLLIYAWNENGEGGYLTPTKSHADAYLREIKAVQQGTWKP